DIFSVNCIDDSDCPTGEICDNRKEWHQWGCVPNLCNESLCPNICYGDALYQSQNCRLGQCSYSTIDCNRYDYYDEYEPYCNGDERRIKRIFHDYGCSQSDCSAISSYYVDDRLIETCEFGCEGGYCSEDPCLEMEVNDACEGDIIKTEGICYNGIITYNSFEDCNDINNYDEYELYCDSDTLKKHRHYYEYTCSDASCILGSDNYIDDEIVEDCEFGCNVSSCLPNPCHTTTYATITLKSGDNEYKSIVKIVIKNRRQSNIGKIKSVEYPEKIKENHDLNMDVLFENLGDTELNVSIKAKILDNNSLLGEYSTEWVNVMPITDDYVLNEFSDKSMQNNIQFNETKNVSKFINIPKNALVSTAYFELESRDDLYNSYLEVGTPDNEFEWNSVLLSQEQENTALQLTDESKIAQSFRLDSNNTLSRLSLLINVISNGLNEYPNDNLKISIQTDNVDKPSGIIINEVIIPKETIIEKCSNKSGWIDVLLPDIFIEKNKKYWIVLSTGSFPQNPYYIRIKSSDIYLDGNLAEYDPINGDWAQYDYDATFKLWPATFLNQRTDDLSSVINDALNNGNCDCIGCEIDNDYCLIPFLFHSDTQGSLKYSNINIDYTLEQDVQHLFEINWPLNLASGKYDLVVDADYGYGVDSNMYSLNIINNTAPIINKINNISIYENGSISITVLATDMESDNLTYSIDDPRFIQDETNPNIFNWKTHFGDVGIYAVRVNVSDGELSSIEAFTVFVNLNASEGRIVKCMDIDNEGDYYLTGDVNITNSTCFNINANNVILDCRENKIIGNKSDDFHGIMITRESNQITNITIKNCIIENWDYAGIYMNNANKNMIENVESRNNRFGVYLDYVDNSLIRNSKWYNNSGDGILINDGFNLTLLNNIIYNNNRWGILTLNGRTIYLINAKIYDNFQSNLNFYLTSEVYVENASLYGSKLYGMEITSSNDLTLRNVEINSKFGIDIRYDTDDWLDECNAILINITGTNSKPILFYNETGTIENWDNNFSQIIFCNAHNSIIKNVTLYNSSRIDVIESENVKITNSKFHNLWWYMTVYYSDNITVYNNFFNRSKGSFILADSIANWNTSKEPGKRIFSKGMDIGGNYWAKPDGTGYSETCEDLDEDGFCDEPYNVDSEEMDYLPLSNKFIPGEPENKPPIINSARIEPEPAYYGDILTGYCNASDEDDERIGYEWKW
ncbi:MAG: right-handed parallel beta-helix repeat-containing protein, partial [Nanoarchaeota archaeon]